VHSATDHDIVARQVTHTGALRGSSHTWIGVNPQNQTNPSISKTCGALDASRSPATQRFTIVWQETAGASNEDIHGALLTWDGVVVPVNGSNTFPIDTSLHRDTFPQVSSPTLPDGAGRRRILAVYERTTTNTGDVVAACLDHDGAILARGNINVLENDPVRLLWQQAKPSVDSDGLRFGVAYHEVYQGNTTVNDLDTRMSLVALAGSSLMVEEAAAVLSAGGNREFNVQVASQYSADGQHSPRYCTANDRDNINTNTFAIDVRTYDAVPTSSIGIRPTACGTLVVTPLGQTTIGGTLAFRFNQAMPLAGYIVGGAANAPVAPCGGCTIGASGNTLFGATLSVTIPMEPGFIGMPLSVQGFAFAAAGPCLGQIHLSDTVDFIVQ
jgi:hypothetical protein